MASVTVQNVVKKYGDLQVIHGLDLGIADGSFVVLLGPSGCGKSTLLRMIAGLEPITSGEVMIADKLVNGVHPKDRNIAMVFQNYALYAHMTVFENMAFALELRKLPKDEIKKKVDWAAAILNLQPYLERYPRQLSGGQRQRVAMGRAIVRNPQVFLFDEPLSNLDAKLRVQMRTEIKELHQRLKTTTVYVTHDQIEAMTMADVIVIMRDGRIEQIGAPLDVYDKPVNLFVAQFIGAPGMNLIEGIVAGTAKAPKLKTAGGTEIPLPARTGLAAGRTVILGIRPEHVSIGKSGPIKTQISVVEPTGPEIHVFCNFQGKDICAITRERVIYRPEQTLALTPDLTRAHVFDPATGMAI